MPVLVALLVFLLIGAVVCWGVRTVLAACKVPEPVASIAYVLVVLVCLVLFLSEIGWAGNAHAWRTWR